MIGYSMYARRFYHKVRKSDPQWAKCDAASMDITAKDDEEDGLRRMAPFLSRCPRCWPAPTAKGEE
jgi:Mn-dependent DtxR family transcriptional regulator